MLITGSTAKMMMEDDEHITLLCHEYIEMQGWALLLFLHLSVTNCAIESLETKTKKKKKKKTEKVKEGKKRIKIKCKRRKKEKI